MLSKFYISIAIGGGALIVFLLLSCFLYLVFQTRKNNRKKRNVLKSGVLGSESKKIVQNQKIAANNKNDMERGIIPRQNKASTRLASEDKNAFIQDLRAPIPSKTANFNEVETESSVSQFTAGARNYLDSARLSALSAPSVATNSRPPGL